MKWFLELGVQYSAVRGLGFMLCDCTEMLGRRLEDGVLGSRTGYGGVLQKLTDNQLRQNYCLCSGDRLLLVHESVYCSPRVHVFVWFLQECR